MWITQRTIISVMGYTVAVLFVSTMYKSLFTFILKQTLHKFHKKIIHMARYQGYATACFCHFCMNCCFKNILATWTSNVFFDIFQGQVLLMTRTQTSILQEYLQWVRFSYLHNVSTKSYKYLVGFMSKYRYNTLRTGSRRFHYHIKVQSQHIYKWKCMIEKKWPIMNYCKTSPT